MLAASQAATTPATPGKWLSGAYVGPCPDDDAQFEIVIEELQDYSNARGRDVQAIMQFMPDRNWRRSSSPTRSCAACSGSARSTRIS